MPSQLKLKNLNLCQKREKWRKKMKAMGKVTLTLGLMIIVSLFLTSCSGVVTPQISMENSNNPSSNNYQDPSTDPVEETVIVATEESATEEQTTNPSSNNPNSNNYQDPSTDPVEEPATEESETVEVDTTKPVITGSRDPLPNSLGWNNTGVTVSFSCADTGPVQSGIDICTVAGEIVTTEGKGQSVTNTGVCIDVAGNVADPVTISNINIDKTPPEVTITLTGTGEYVVNKSITATWSATDALSGVVSPVSGTVSIDTSSVGTKTFTLPAGTAMDKAGNSSPEVTISYSVIEDTEDPGTENPQKWSGLGMFAFNFENTSIFDEQIDTLLTYGFEEIRVELPAWDSPGELADSKAAVIRAIAKGADVIWGITSPGTVLTSTNWSDYANAVEAAAQWAQNNGVFEFQIGNEEEIHNDDDTLTDTQLIANLKTLATSVQAIFTSGNVSYACDPDYISNWITAGKGDLDFLSSNVYMSWGAGNPSNWKDFIDDLINGFGANGTYLTEFSLNTEGLDNYSEDEAVQAAAVTEMIEYIKASGMTRAIYFAYKSPPWLSGFGVLKDDGTYRLLWNQALLNTGPVKFATVPTKTTTISLPDTIALMPKITR